MKNKTFGIYVLLLCLLLIAVYFSTTISVIVTEDGFIMTADIPDSNPGTEQETYAIPFDTSIGFDFNVVSSHLKTDTSIYMEDGNGELSIIWINDYPGPFCVNGSLENHPFHDYFRIYDMNDSFHLINSANQTLSIVEKNDTSMNGNFGEPPYKVRFYTLTSRGNMCGDIDSLVMLGAIEVSNITNYVEDPGNETEEEIVCYWCENYQLENASYVRCPEGTSPTVVDCGSPSSGGGGGQDWYDHMLDEEEDVEFVYEIADRQFKVPTIISDNWLWILLILSIIGMLIYAFSGDENEKKK